MYISVSFRLFLSLNSDDEGGRAGLARPPLLEDQGGGSGPRPAEGRGGGGGGGFPPAPLRRAAGPGGSSRPDRDGSKHRRRGTTATNQRRGGGGGRRRGSKGKGKGRSRHRGNRRKGRVTPPGPGGTGRGGAGGATRPAAILQSRGSSRDAEDGRQLPSLLRSSSSTSSSTTTADAAGYNSLSLCVVLLCAHQPQTHRIRTELSVGNGASWEGGVLHPFRINATPSAILSVGANSFLFHPKQNFSVEVIPHLFSPHGVSPSTESWVGPRSRKALQSRNEPQSWG